MKIALVTETYPPEVNGVAMTLHRLATGLVSRGQELEIVRPRQSRSDSPQDARNYRETLLPGLPLPGYQGLHFGLPAKGRLRRNWQNSKPDVIHVATEGPLGWSAIRAARHSNIPVVSSFHTNFHAYGKHYGYGRLQSVALSWLRYIHNNTLATFAPSEDLIALLNEEGFHNLMTLSRGVDTTLFNPQHRSHELRLSWGIENDQTPVALYVGRLAGEKNISLTVKAYEVMRELIPDLHLVLVGDGPERARLQKAHPEIHFAGLRRGEDLAAHYASGDVFLFASITETFGNVITEAMASGLCVLSYNYAAAQRYIIHNENGLSAPLGDEKAYLENARLLAQEKEKWASLRVSARKTAEAISWDTVIDKYLDDIDLVLNKAD